MKSIILGNKNSNLFIAPINHRIQSKISRLQKEYEKVYKFDRHIVGRGDSFKKVILFFKKLIF